VRYVALPPQEFEIGFQTGKLPVDGAGCDAIIDEFNHPGANVVMGHAFELGGIVALMEIL
jgi:hypothetical protein